MRAALPAANQALRDLTLSVPRIWLESRGLSFRPFSVAHPAMPLSSPRSISIAVARDTAQLTATQKAFNALVRQIDGRRARLGAWDAITPAFHQQYVNDLVPLQKRHTDLAGQLVHRIDQTFDEGKVSKAERRVIARLIVELAGRVIDKSDDATLNPSPRESPRLSHGEESGKLILTSICLVLYMAYLHK